METAFSFLKRNVRADLMDLDLEVLDSMTGTQFRELVTNSSKCLTKKVTLSMLRANHFDLAATLELGKEKSVPMTLNHNPGTYAMERKDSGRYSIFTDLLEE